MSDEPVAGGRLPVAGEGEPAADAQLEQESLRPPATGNRPLTAEEIEAERVAAIRAAIEANDREVADRLRRMSRRGFITLGAGAVAAIGAWRWLGSRDREGGLPWPLRRMLHLNEGVALAYFSTSRLSPTFPASKITRPARVNGGIGIEHPIDLASWRLDVAGHALTLDDVKSFPKRTMITEFRCIEGWSTVVQWSGTRLADVMAKLPPPSGAPRPPRPAPAPRPGRPAARAAGWPAPARAAAPWPAATALPWQPPQSAAAIVTATLRPWKEANRPVASGGSPPAGGQPRLMVSPLAWPFGL